MGTLIPTPAEREAAEARQAIIAAALAGAPLPEMKRAPRYSATTIKRHAACKRKTWWDFAGVPEPTSPAQSEGTEGHLIAEHYLRGLPPPDTAGARMTRVFEPGRHLLPEPRDDLRIEDPFSIDWVLPTDETINVVGTVDLHEPPTDDSPLIVHDHKFIKDLKWQLSKEELADDVQANLYAHVLMWRYGVESVVLQWTFYQKSYPHVARQTRVERVLAETQRYCDDVIEPVLVDMSRIARERPSLHVIEPNLDECDKYRGCAHKKYCTKSPTLAQLPPSSTPVHNISPYRRRKEKEKEAMGMLTASRPTNKPAPIAPAATNAPPVNKNEILARAKTLAAQRVNPPPAAPVPAHESDGTLLVNDDTLPPEAKDVVPQEPKKRGRKPKNAAETVATAAAQVENAFAAPAGSTRAPGYNSGHSYWLFVSSLPTKGFTAQMHNLDVLVGPAMADAAQVSEQPVDHYMLAPYSAGPKNLEATFASWMEQNAITGAVYVDRFTPAAGAVLGLLRAHAALVIEKLG